MFCLNWGSHGVQHCQAQPRVTNLGQTGEVLSDKLEIACTNNQSIKILEIQRQGKKPQKIGEFMLGSSIRKGSLLSNA